MPISISKAARLIILEIKSKVKLIIPWTAYYTCVTIKCIFVNSKIFKTFMWPVTMTFQISASKYNLFSPPTKHLIKKGVWMA